MKFSTSFFVLLSSSLVAAKGLSFSYLGKDQKVLYDPSLSIPGDNPLQYCQASHDDDLLEIEHVNLYPNPPIPGQNLTIEAVGTFKKQIEEGAIVNLEVKYGFITLIKTQADACEQVGNVDLSCPIEKGKTTVTKQVAIPAQVPAGKYAIFAEVWTSAEADKERITCLTAAVTFSKQP